MSIFIIDARMHTDPRMAEIMSKRNDSPNIRKGRFLWMEPREQQQFIESLKDRIANGYYYSDSILGRVADELTPVLSELTGE